MENRNYILDTDIGPDCDDAAALALAVLYARRHGRRLLAVTHCLEKFFPRMTDEDVQGFLYAFFPFMFGIYPYTAVTEQQRTAMELAGVGYVRISVRELTRSFTAKLLQGFQM